MRTYETIAILKVDFPEKQIATLVKKVEKAASNKPGQLVRKDDWGVKKLAYEIEKQKQGRYLFWRYENESATPKEVDQCLRYDENVLRYVTYVMDDDDRVHQKNLKKLKEEKRNKEVRIDFKNPASLVKYMTDRGKIVPSRVSGATGPMQRRIAREIKRARQLALLSYVDGFGSQPAPHYEDGAM